VTEIQLCKGATLLVSAAEAEMPKVARVTNS